MEKLFGFWTSYLYSINMMIGVGVLALPYEFQEAGWLFCTLATILLALIAYYLISTLFEVMSKVEYIFELENQGIQSSNNQFISYSLNNKENLLPGLTELKPEITDRRIDLSEIISVLFGFKMSAIYCFLIILYGIGALTSYCSVFSASLASNIPIGSTCNIYDSTSFFSECRLHYWFFLGIYLVLMLVLVLLGIKEQRPVQIFLAFMRFLIIFLLLSTSIQMLVSQDNIDGAGTHNSSYPKAVNWSNASSAISTIIFSLYYHTQYPSVSACIGDKEKNLRKVNILVFSSCTAMYILMGLIIPPAIDSINPQVTLNYDNYSPGSDSRKWYAYLIGYLLVIFPALDVMSCFPLVAIAVSDNIISLALGTKNANTKKIKLIRVVCTLLPFAIAFFVYDLV